MAGLIRLKHKQQRINGTLKGVTMTKTTKEKNQAELEIEALAEVFNIATTGFEEYYKTCDKNSKGTDSKAAFGGCDL